MEASVRPLPHSVGDGDDGNDKVTTIRGGRSFDCYHRLEIANRSVSSALRSDEGSMDADLYRRIVNCSSSCVGGATAMMEQEESSSFLPPRKMYFPACSGTNTSVGSIAKGERTTKTASANALSGVPPEVATGTGERDDGIIGVDRLNRRLAEGVGDAAGGGLFGGPAPWNPSSANSSPPRRLSGASSSRSSYDSGNVTSNLNDTSRGASSGGVLPTMFPSTAPTRTVHVGDDSPQREASRLQQQKRRTTLLTATVERRHTIPFPPQITRELSGGVQISSLMGILPEAHLCWMSVDDKLYLWSYASSSEYGNCALIDSDGRLSRSLGETGSAVHEDFCSFAVPGGQCIVSVGLVRPKLNVFVSKVEWCVVVSTPEEVVLCALIHEEQGTGSGGSGGGLGVEGQKGCEEQGFGPKGSLRLVPTSYIIPTDGVSMMKIVGTKGSGAEGRGRVFMGGADGNLYEMAYEGLRQWSCKNAAGAAIGHFGISAVESSDINDDDDYEVDENFIENERSLSGRIWSGSKRMLSSLLPGQQPSSKRRRCDKINHTRPSTWSSLLPGFSVRLVNSLSGGGEPRAGNAAIVDVTVDENLAIVYTLDARGTLSLYDIGPQDSSGDGSGNRNGNVTSESSSCRLVATFDTPKAARRYLEAVTRSTSYFSGSCTGARYNLAGGSAAAAAGLGGVDNARAWVKLVSSISSTSRSGTVRSGRESMINTGVNVLQPVRVQTIPSIESATLNVIVFTRGGLRLYLSTVLEGSAGGLSGRQKFGVTLCHVRAPPSVNDVAESWRKCAGQGEPEGRRSMLGHMKSGASSPSPVLAARQRRGVSSSVDPLVLVGSFYAPNCWFVGVDGSALSMLATIPSHSGGDTDDGRDEIEGDVVMAMLPSSLRRCGLPGDAFVTDDRSGYLPGGGVTAGTLEGLEGLGAESTAQEALALPLAERNFFGTSSSGGEGGNCGLIPGGRIWEIASAWDGTKRLIDVLCERSSTPSGDEVDASLKHLLPPLKPPTDIVQNEIDDGFAEYRQRPPRYKIATGWRKGFLNPVHLQRSIRGHSSLYGRGVSTGVGERSTISGSGGSDSRGGFTLCAVTPTTHISRLCSSCPVGADGSGGGDATTTFLVLNSGGLHLFQYRSIIDNLRSILRSRRDNKTSSLDFEGLFDSYGNVEGCAMCLYLAVHDKGRANAMMYNAAKEAALDHGLRPFLSSASDGGGQFLSGSASGTTAYVNGAGAVSSFSPSLGGGGTASDGLLTALNDVPPPGYIFHSSALHNGLLLLIGRILRPIWFKPVVVVIAHPVGMRQRQRTKGRTGVDNRRRMRQSRRAAARGMHYAASSSSSSSSSTCYYYKPRTVEFLLDLQTEEYMISLLKNLEQTMRDIFPSRAIASVPTHPLVAQHDTAMDVDGDEQRQQNGHGSGMKKMKGFITGSLRYQQNAAMQYNSAQTQAPLVNSGAGTSQAGRLSQQDLHSLAQYLEESSVHNLYRLVSRARQLLCLVNILRRHQHAEDVEWGLLTKLTHCQLVCAPEGMERIGSVLNALVSGGGGGRVEMNGIMDRSLTQKDPLSSLMSTSSLYAMDEYSSRETDRLISSISDQAYLYFSKGNLLTHQGFAASKLALNCPEGSVQRVSASNKAAALFRRAARYWTSPKLVSGQVLHSETTAAVTIEAGTTRTRMSPTDVTLHKREEQEQIQHLVSYFEAMYNKALPRSPLVRAVQALGYLGHVGGIVDVCLACAANFGGSVAGTSAEEDALAAEGGGGTKRPKGMFAWEVGLYHGKSGNMNEVARHRTSGSDPVSLSSGAFTGTAAYSSGVTGSGSPFAAHPSSPSSSPPLQNSSSPSSSIVEGLEVTPADARQTCYAVLLHYLNNYLRMPDTAAKADGMISVCTAATADLFLQRALYTFLLATNHLETLLRITPLSSSSSSSSSFDDFFLVRWLRDEHRDPELLWRYYVLHNRNNEACEVMKRRATTEDENVTLHERIECLTRAINSADAAATASVGGGAVTRGGRIADENGGNVGVSDRSVELLQRNQLRELLEVAGIQERILTAITDRSRVGGSAGGTPSAALLDSSSMERLSVKLVCVSDLYNEYAAPFGLWEICLAILLSCHCNDASNIDTLWRLIIYKELLPWTKTGVGGRGYLEHVLLRLRQGTPFEDSVAEEHAEDGGNFESGDWISPLKDKVTMLGRELYGKGADYTFPISLLLRYLEDLRRIFLEMNSQVSSGADEVAPTFGPWPMLCFVETGVKFAVILDSYSSAASEAEREGEDPNVRLHYIKCISEIITEWVQVSSQKVGHRDEVSSRNGRIAMRDSARAQLVQAVSNGLRSSIDTYKASLEALVGGNPREVSKLSAVFNDIEIALGSI